MNGDYTVSNDNQTNNWSVQKCVFCNTLLDEKSKILKCLHIVCQKCLPTASNDLGILCVCQEITQGELNNYPITLVKSSTVKICSERICDVQANKICALCENIYCKLCAKTHVCSKKGFIPDFMRAYPMQTEFVLCPNCSKKTIDVYCTKCSVMICSLCHLNFHRRHKYVLVEKFVNKFKKEMFNQKLNLEKDNVNLDYCLGIIKNQVENLEKEKELVYETIDTEINILRMELDKRALELKRSVDNYVLGTVSIVNENNKILQDMQIKNKYYIDLTDSILNNGKTNDIVNLSKIVLNKTKAVQSISSNIQRKVTAVNMNMDFDFKQTSMNCLSSIKAVGNVISVKVFNLLDNSPNVLRSIENQGNILNEGEIKMECESSSSEYIPLAACSCCNQWAEELIKCTYCNRNYHSNCHIPTLQYAVYDPSNMNWKCTLCKDITKYSKVLNQRHNTNDIPLESLGRKIVEWILLELFCQNGESDHFRDCPQEDLYPLYYQQITHPISLNDIKNRLESGPSYTNLFDVIRDMKRVFSNATSYYKEFDPYYISAYNLQLLLNNLLIKCFPKFDLTLL